MINILGGLNTLVSLEEVIVFHNYVIWKQKKSSCTFGSMYLTNQQTAQKMAKSWAQVHVSFSGVTGSSTFFFWFLYHSAYFYVLPLGLWPGPAWSSDRCQSLGNSERIEVASSYLQLLFSLITSKTRFQMLWDSQRIVSAVSFYSQHYPEYCEQKIRCAFIGRMTTVFLFCIFFRLI